MQSGNYNRDALEQAACTQMFSWTPIIIGGLIALGLGFLLDLFAKGIGLSLYTNDVNGATTLAISGFVALIIGAIATMFTAGFAAGFFAGPTCGKRNFGVAYGFVAWCLGLLLMGMFSSHMGSTLSGPVSPYSHTMNEVANTTHNVAAKINPATDNQDTAAEKNVRTAGAVSLAMFIIFFVGALAASFGGYFGFCCWEKKLRGLN